MRPPSGRSLRAGRESQIAEALLKPSKTHAPGADWWRGAMFYEIYVRSFKDSDGDGIGDLPGLLAKIDYLASLGVDGIWLSPFYQSPQRDYGYDISDFCSVDPSQGSLDDVRRLIELCHARKLKLLLDFVPCHSSSEHPWFAESRRSRYTADGERLHAVYDFDLINVDQTLEQWMERFDIRTSYIGSGWLMNCFTNHDSVRAVSNLLAFAVEAGRGTEAAKLLLFLQATLRGGGIVFQGEELGLTQPQLDFEHLTDPWSINLWPDFVGRDGVRTPIPWESGLPHGGFSTARPWLPCVEEHLPLAVDRQEQDPDSVLNFFRQLMAWRRRQPVLRVGRETAGAAANAPLVVFDRISPDHHLTIVLNFSLEERCFEAGEKAVLSREAPGSGARLQGQQLQLPGLSFAVLDRGGSGGHR